MFVYVYMLADAAADGSVPAAAVAEPPIGGAESRGVASITGEPMALDAMEQDELEELELGGSGKRRELGFANGSGRGEDEALGIYSGRAEIHATVKSQDFRHASRIEPL